MTETTIEVMKPGRELDALVAEKVMGLCPCPQDRRWITSPDTKGFEGSSVWSDNGVWRCTKHNKIAFGGSKHAFSTSIAAAWEVVEKLREKDWGFQIDDAGYDGERWRVCFGDPEKKGFTMFDADTAPHAICLAALKAVGCQVEVQ